jgi:hypothetical protein
MVRAIVHLLRRCDIAASLKRHQRPQYHFGEMTSGIRRLDHRPDRFVRVSRHDNAGLGTQVQIPQHVTRRERHH